jgi:hypothetical protein
MMLLTLATAALLVADPMIPPAYGSYRGWAYPSYPSCPGCPAVRNGSCTACEGAVVSEYLYPKGTVNFAPNGEYFWDPDVTLVGWAYCWNSQWISQANGSVLNVSQVEDYFEHQATPPPASTGILGPGLDECLLNNENAKGEKEAAATGFRNARRKNPTGFVAAWGSQEGDRVFASLMADGTFDLAMVEAYTYCPGCGGWPNGSTCCTTAQWTEPDPTKWIAAYTPRLDFARAQGYLNRTIFCFGTGMQGRSAINPRGWTIEIMRTLFTFLKQTYPELAGVSMYGGDPGFGWNGTAWGQQMDPAADNATLTLIHGISLLMLEFYPDPPATATATSVDGLRRQ